MPCNRKSSTLPLPCQQLADARAQLHLMVTGNAVSVIETPQLGRVEYSPAGGMSIPELQRYIAQLAAQCRAAGGDPGTGYYARGPISFEVNP